MSATAIDKLESKRKSGPLAAGLNLVLPGAGYIYCGRILLGIIVLPFVLLIGVVTSGVGALPILVILVIDGFLAANRYNKQLDTKIAASMKTCPQCAEKVQPEAKICKHCGASF